jgi:transposase-like protein
MPRPSIHTPEKKAAMLAIARQMLRDGSKRKDVATHLGINIASLSGWLREQTLDQLLPPAPPTMPRARAHNY